MARQKAKTKPSLILPKGNGNKFKSTLYPEDPEVTGFFKNRRL